MILFMSADSPALPAPGIAIETVDQFIGPVVGLTNADGVALKTYLAAHPGLRVSIDLAGVEVDINTYSQTVQFSPPVMANQLGSYSSFGPNAGDGAIKPEIVATGGLDVFLMPDPNNSGLVPLLGPLYGRAEVRSAGSALQRQRLRRGRRHQLVSRLSWPEPPPWSNRPIRSTRWRKLNPPWSIPLPRTSLRIASATP